MRTFLQYLEDAGMVGATVPGQWSDVGGSSEFMNKMTAKSRPKYSTWDGESPPEPRQVTKNPFHRKASPKPWPKSGIPPVYAPTPFMPGN